MQDITGQQTYFSRYIRSDYTDFCRPNAFFCSLYVNALPMLAY